MGRAQVFLRILVVALISWVAGSGGQLSLLYLGVPTVAAILIAQKGGDRYLSENGDTVTRWLAFVVGLFAYLNLVVDELPTLSNPNIRLTVNRSGSPTVGGALMRILLGLPSAFVLAIVGVVSWIVWVIAAISVLVNEQYPESLWRFQRGVLQWEARLLGYLASIVEPYPPFSFERQAATVA